MENTYLTALHGMEGMFQDEKNLIQQFNKKMYVSAFQSYYVNKLPVFQALEEGYTNAMEKEIYLSNMAEALVNAAKEQLTQCKRKHQIDNERINLNLMMVTYIFPSILKFNGTCSKALVDTILGKWKEAFPESKISPAQYEDIESGFHKKWCYITTAVCENLGKADNCYELNILRDYRDHYLSQLKNGEEMIREYYDVAPTIVKKINNDPNHDSIYQGIWGDYIQPCIKLIEEEKNEECCSLYMKMVHALENKYFYLDS